MRHYYTTHDVAALAQVSPSTVLNWIERGLLRAQRTPGGHRRIQRAQLIEFFRGQGLAVPTRLSDVQRVLIIDSDAASLRTSLDVMRKRAPQVEVDGVANGVDGMLACGAKPPDAVLLDVSLSHVDALEACRRLTSDHDVRVIAVSRISSSSQRAAYLRAGATGYLVAPVAPDALLEALGLDVAISAE